MGKSAQKRGAAGKSPSPIATTSKNQCIGSKANGKPCNANAQHGKAYCWFHDPTRKRERLAASSTGGKARHGRKVGSITPPPDVKPIAPIDTLQDLKAAVNLAIADVWGMERSFNRTRSLNALFLTMRAVMTDSEIERQIADIQAKQAEILERQK